MFRTIEAPQTVTGRKKSESTLSSIVSNFVSSIPSISLGFGEVDRSANFCGEKAKFSVTQRCKYGATETDDEFKRAQT